MFAAWVCGVVLVGLLGWGLEQGGCLFLFLFRVLTLLMLVLCPLYASRLRRKVGGLRVRPVELVDRLAEVLLAVFGLQLRAAKIGTDLSAF